MNTPRLSPEVFDLPTVEIRNGYRSAVYFNRAKEILSNNPHPSNATMQVFQKKDAVLCGIDEALAVLRCATGYYSDQKKSAELFREYRDLKRVARAEGPTKNKVEALTRMVEVEAALDELWVSAYDVLDIEALRDGDEIRPWEPVMHIRGPLEYFVHLESVYLGVLARRTKVATNVRNVAVECNGKPLLFFADRFDHFATQGGDGYAAKIGGSAGVATDAMGDWWGAPGLGTMPHALIAEYGGNVVDATAAFHEAYPDVSLISLVDFNNDCVGDSLACARAFGDKLWGVRLDTSENMVDQSIMLREMGDFKPTGVNPELVRNVRKALDAEGFHHVKVVVSGGFNADKIRAFEADKVPVDVYAVGSSLLQGSYDFTADVVQPVAKAGRKYRSNPRLEKA